MNNRTLHLIVFLLLFLSANIIAQNDKRDIVLKKDSKYEKVDGSFFNFDDVAGKVVFLEVWATWCGPCKRQHPEVEILFQKINHSDLALVNLSVDRDKSKWQNFMLKNPWTGKSIILDWNNTADPLLQMTNTEYEYNGETVFKTAVPQYYIIDKELNVTKVDRPSAAGVEEQLWNLLDNSTAD